MYDMLHIHIFSISVFPTVHVVSNDNDNFSLLCVIVNFTELYVADFYISELEIMIIFTFEFTLHRFYIYIEGTFGCKNVPSM